MTQSRVRAYLCWSGSESWQMLSESVEAEAIFEERCAEMKSAEPSGMPAMRRPSLREILMESVMGR